MKRIKLSKKAIYEFLLIILLAAIMAYIMGIGENQEWRYVWRRFVITYIIWLVMWYGNSLVAHGLDKIYTFLNNPVKRFILGVVGSAIYSGFAMFVLIWFFKVTINIAITNNPTYTVLFTMLFSVLIFTILLAREFLFSWRALALREEKMRNEVLVSRYEVLKNQINPHFMFNSLNALSSLVHEDQDLAVEYINQLSKVFRYVLQAGKQEVVSLPEELDVLNSYVFLQKIRYNDNLKVEIDPAVQQTDKYVAPLVLQMLLENAIKHNEITRDNPLTIHISLQDDYLLIANNLQKKTSSLPESTETGLKNIRDRYQTLSDKEVVIRQTGDEFAVAIPLITVDKH